MTSDQITFADGRMRIVFDRFDAGESYSLFKRAKQLPEWECEFDPERETYAITAPARFARMLGLELPSRGEGDLPLSAFLFDDQAAVVRMALDAKRFACWSDCGSGKSLVGLEWSRQVVHRTGGRVLIFTRNEIVNQWIDEARKFYGDSLPIIRLDSRQAMKDWSKGGEPGLAVTNYEKLNYAREGSDGQVVREFSFLAGIVLDEGSRLRTAGGRQKWSLIKSCEQIAYKLILTATPAPNDYAEFMSQAGFLNKFRAEQSINAFFSRDDKTHRWTVKPHARQALFEFMASWSIYIRDPRRYGWRQGFADIPPPIVTHHPIEATEQQRDLMRLLTADADGKQELFPSKDLNTIQRGKLSQLAKGFRYLKGSDGRRGVERVQSRKPAFVADLVRREALELGAQVLVWTVFDAEGEILAELLASGRGRKAVSFDLLTGKTPKRQRAAMLERFRAGESKVLISRADMLGFGMNLQHCKAMVFSGWNDCYSQDTEILTRRGWLSFGDVSLSDEIGTVNQTSLGLEWQRPSRIVWEPYSGPMLHFGGKRNFDLLVTPNHKLFVQRCPVRYGRDCGEWKLKYAADIASQYRRQEYRMLSAASCFRGPKPTAIKVPMIDRGKKSHPQRTVREIPAGDFMRLAGWYLTEGYCRPLGTKEFGKIGISQTSVNSQHRNEIVELMRSLGLHVWTSRTCVLSYCGDLAGFLINEFGAGSHHKRIPDWVKNLDSSLLTILRDTMLKGDGCHKTRHAPKASFYRTVSKRLADDFQELCVKTGLRGTVRQRDSSSRYSDNLVWDVNLAWENTSPSISTPPEVIPYDGLIGCVTVPNRVIIVRRNGTPVVSGNSYEAWYQALRRAYRYGQTDRLRVHVPVIEQLYRVTAPGCNTCIHVQQLIANKNQHGFMGRRDFRGAIIEMFTARQPGGGCFRFTGEFVIKKDQRRMAKKTKLHSLQFKTGWARCSTMWAPAVNDYVLIFQNPAGWMTRDEWIRDAAGVWTDIMEIDVIDGARSPKQLDRLKEQKRERHVCPLQHSVILRCIRLYSNPIRIQPDVLVLDPFAGIGTTGYVALGGASPVTKQRVEEPRSFVGFELKPSYHRQAVENLAKALEGQPADSQQTMFTD